MNTIGDCPYVDVMDILDTFDLSEGFLDFLNVIVIGRALHEHMKAALDDGKRLNHNDDREDVGADGVGNGCVVEKGDNDRSNNDTDRIEEITKDMELS